MSPWTSTPQHPPHFYALQALFQKPIDQVDLLPAFRAAQDRGYVRINVSCTGVIITREVQDEVVWLFKSGDFTPVNAHGHWQCTLQRIYMIQAINYLKHDFLCGELPEVVEAWEKVRDGLRPGSELWIN